MSVCSLGSSLARSSSHHACRCTTWSTPPLVQGAMQAGSPCPIHRAVSRDCTAKVLVKRNVPIDEAQEEVLLLQRLGKSAFSMDDDRGQCVLRESVTGQTLEEFVTSQGEDLNENARLELACRVGAMIFTELDHIHSIGAVNLDLNMQTIQFRSDEMDKVEFTSWGMATTEGVYYSPEDDPNVAFRAPELLEHKGGDISLEVLKSCDIWSIGVIMFTIAVGRLPFGEADAVDVLERIKRLDFSFQHNPRLSRKFKMLITTIFHLDVSARFGFGHPAVPYDHACLYKL